MYRCKKCYKDYSDPQTQTCPNCGGELKLINGTKMNFVQKTDNVTDLDFIEKYLREFRFYAYASLFLFWTILVPCAFLYFSNKRQYVIEKAFKDAKENLKEKYVENKNFEKLEKDFKKISNIHSIALFGSFFFFVIIALLFQFNILKF